MTDWSLREADAGDIEVLAEMRRLMFAAIRPQAAAEDLGSIAASFVEFARERMPSRAYRAWIAEADGGAIGTIGRIVEIRPSTLRNRDGRVGYLLNVYVEPEWRRRGVGRSLVELALAALHEEGVAVAALHASDEGRALYAGMGFEPSSEMRLFRP